MDAEIGQHQCQDRARDTPSARSWQFQLLKSAIVSGRQLVLCSTKEPCGLEQSRIGRNMGISVGVGGC